MSVNPQAAVSCSAGLSPPSVNFPCYLLLRDRHPKLSAVSWLAILWVSGLGRALRALFAPPGALGSLGQWRLVGGLRYGLGPGCWLLAGTPQFSTGASPSSRTDGFLTGWLVPREQTWGSPAPKTSAPNPKERPSVTSCGADPGRGERPRLGVEASRTRMRGGRGGVVTVTTPVQRGKTGPGPSLPPLPQNRQASKKCGEPFPGEGRGPGCLHAPLSIHTERGGLLGAWPWVRHRGLRTTQKWS